VQALSGRNSFAALLVQLHQPLAEERVDERSFCLATAENDHKNTVPGKLDQPTKTEIYLMIRLVHCHLQNFLADDDEHQMQKKGPRGVLQQ
jgi:hypothetical protein